MNTKTKQLAGKIFKMSKSFVLFLVIATFVLSFNLKRVSADNPAIATITSMSQQIGLPGFESGHTSSSYQPGASNITSAIYYTLDLLKYILGSIAVLVIIFSGVRLITSVKEVDDVVSKQKENFKYGLIGLIVIMGADVLIKKVAFGEYGEVFRSKTDIQLAATRGTEQILGIFNFISMGLGALAMLMIIIAGIRLVLNAGEEEAQTKAKQQITWAIGGLVVIGLAELVVYKIMFPEQGTRLPDLNEARNLIVKITNFVSSFIATAAVAMFMYGGYLYVVDAGKDENPAKAKQVFLGATIGILIAFAAFAFVNTVIEFKPLEDTGIITQETENAGLLVEPPK